MHSMLSNLHKSGLHYAARRGVHGLPVTRAARRETWTVLVTPSESLIGETIAIKAGASLTL